MSSLFRYTYLVLLLLVSISSEAQIGAYQNELENIFEQEGIEDIRLFEGTMDGVHHLMLVLGTKDGTVLGYYEYLKSHLRFELEGSYKGNKLELIETDDNDQTSGFLILTEADETLEGDWRHTESAMYKTLDLHRVNNFRSKSPCNHSHWTKVYESKIQEDKLILYLEKNNRGSVQTKFILNDQNHNLPADEITKDLFEIQLSEISSLYESMRVKIRANNSASIVVNYQEKSGSEQANAILTDQLKLECFEEVTYASSMAGIYPVLEEADFNAWMGQQITAWSKKESREMENLIAANPGRIPDDRFKYSAIAWVDIHHFSKHCLSGLLNFQCSWKTAPKRVPFIFDRTEVRMITADEIFKADFRKFREQWVEKNKLEYPPFQEKLLRKWLEQQSFHYLTVKDDGACLSTEFSTIFGSKQIFIPGDQLKEFVQDKYQKIFSLF